MDTKNVILYVFDTKENFSKSIKYLGVEGSTFKRIICVEDAVEFEKEFSILDVEEYVFMVVHAFCYENISGIKRFAASLIEKKLPNLGFMYISDGDSKQITKLMIDADIKIAPVNKYHQVQSALEEERYKVYRKREILQLAGGISTELKSENASFIADTEFPLCDYAIITALEEDEMEKILPMLTITGTIKNDKHLIEYGYLTSNPEKKIAFASQQSTGMVDAAILATELILRFHPKFLIMPGVLGGNPQKVGIGDIIVSTKVFVIDKGKLTEKEILDEIDSEKDKERIVEKEIESVKLDSSYITRFIREKDKILKFISKMDETRKKNINILFGPIACVRQVIDQKGYFEENILIIDRKTIGLEMESYGIARACELVNDGKTTPLIIKAAMDNTIDKVDDAKTYAAWTSAMFIKYILENDLI